MKQPTYIINDLTLVAPDRNRKDIQTLKNAVISSESIYAPNRVQLYDLYHDVLSLDGFLRGILDKRIKSILNKKLKFYDREGNENKEITKLMKSNTGRNLITQIINSEFWGISGVEFKIGGAFEFEEIPRKHIKPEKGIISKSQYAYGDENGFKYDDMPFVWVIGAILLRQNFYNRCIIVLSFFLTFAHCFVCFNYVAKISDNFRYKQIFYDEFRHNKRENFTIY